MAEVTRPDESPLNIAIRLTEALINEHLELAEIAEAEPIDCVALYDLIQAAQKVYTKFCPGP